MAKWWQYDPKDHSYEKQNQPPIYGGNFDSDYSDNYFPDSSDSSDSSDSDGMRSYIDGGYVSSPLEDFKFIDDEDMLNAKMKIKKKGLEPPTGNDKIMIYLNFPMCYKSVSQREMDEIGKFYNESSFSDLENQKILKSKLEFALDLDINHGSNIHKERFDPKIQELKELRDQLKKKVEPIYKDVERMDKLEAMLSEHLENLMEQYKKKYNHKCSSYDHLICFRDKLQRKQKKHTNAVYLLKILKCFPCYGYFLLSMRCFRDHLENQSFDINGVSRFNNILKDIFHLNFDFDSIFKLFCEFDDGNIQGLALLTKLEDIKNNANDLKYVFNYWKHSSAYYVRLSSILKASRYVKPLTHPYDRNKKKC